MLGSLAASFLAVLSEIAVSLRLAVLRVEPKWSMG
jgi:hypothetical protein